MRQCSVIKSVEVVPEGIHSIGTMIDPIGI